MTRLLLLAGAAALLGTTPALAEKGGKGQGQKAHAAKQVGAKASVKANSKAAFKANATGRSKSTTRLLRDRDRDGIDDRDEALARKYGGALCPPGLAKKTPACVPPGQAKRMFREGQRVSPNYRYYTPYGEIPAALVTRHSLTQDYRYIYRNNLIYVVDPQTRLIRNILEGVL